LPLETEIKTYLQYKSPVRALQSLEEINNSSGFVFSPFDTTPPSKTYLIEPDCVFTDNEISEQWFETIQNSTQKQNTITIVENENCGTTSKDVFVHSVSRALDAIEQGLFQKVVLSKTQRIDKPADFSESAFFQSLCKQYPHAFVYFIYLADNCCWMGASPEPLLITNENSMQTVSLAGTQPDVGLAVEDYSWSQKELDEQAVVTQFIEQALIEKGVNGFRKSAVHNYKAANLIHLKSVFEFPSINQKVSLAHLITALHPTPSVGGLPRHQALQFIQAAEQHPRSYYTGFLGTVTENVQLFVNLRCMQLFPASILLYSGAGITKGSVPENEWIETENKLQTLKQVIFSSKL
jgi:isochorismate synthase